MKISIFIKKAAMFGLDARIKKLCHAGLDPVSHALNNKRAAMFGLDARIALAIFGALSVISGAALYSAIENAKATALLTDLKEVGKAWEAYLLDTGSDLPAYNSDKNFRDMTGLVKDNDVSGWNGPYTSLLIHPDHLKTLKHPLFDGEVHLISIKNETWGGAENWDSHLCTDDDKDCYLWVYIDNVTSNYHKKIDDIVDGGDGASAGDYRWVTLSDTFDDRIFLKIAPYGKPNQ